MADETRRATKKYAAIKRAERRLQHRLDDIDWELDVLTPEVEAIKDAGAIEATHGLVELNEGGSNDAAGNQDS